MYPHEEEAERNFKLREGGDVRWSRETFYCVMLSLEACHDIFIHQGIPAATTSWKM